MAKKPLLQNAKKVDLCKKMGFMTLIGGSVKNCLQMIFITVYVWLATMMNDFCDVIFVYQ